MYVYFMFEKDEDGVRNVTKAGNERIGVFWLPRSGAETSLIIKLMADCKIPLPHIFLGSELYTECTNDQRRRSCRLCIAAAPNQKRNR